MLIFYVYEHWRPDKDICFYVGKGKGRRAYTFDKNKHYNKVAAKLARLGMCVEVRMVESGLSEPDAFIVERRRIAFWRSLGIELTNKTDGGEGASGFLHSASSRAKIAAKRIGTKDSAETRIKKSEAAKKRPPRSAETRAKMSASLTETYKSDELRTFVGNLHRGKLVSAATRTKQRQNWIAQGGIPQTEDGRRLTAAKNSGQKRSEETKALLRLRWAERKRSQKYPEIRARMSAGSKIAAMQRQLAKIAS